MSPLHNLILRVNAAPPPQLNWVKQIGSTDSENMEAVAVDSAGNVISVGNYQGTNTDFDRDNVVSGDTHTTQNIADIAIVKYNSSGVLQWDKAIGTLSGLAGEGAYEVAVDQSDNVYVIGVFRFGTLDFDEDNVVAGDTKGSGPAFLVKYNSSGVLQFVKTAGASFQDLAVDSSGNTYVAASMSGSVIDFDQDNTVSGDTISSAGSNDAVLAKYNSSGVLQWVKGLGGTGLDNGIAVDVDASDNPIFTGEFRSSSIDLDEDNVVSGDTLTLTPGSTALTGDIFVAKYNPSGVVQWVKQVGGTNNETPTAIKTDSSSFIYVGGSYSSSSLDFDRDNVVSGDTLAGGLTASFLAKYNSSGVLSWVKSIGGSGITLNLLSIDVDGSSNVFIGGGFNGTSVDFDTNNVVSGDTATSSSIDIFVARYSPAGVLSILVTPGGSSVDQAYGVAASKTDETFYVAGSFSSSSIDFDENNVVSGDTKSATGLADGFTAKYTAMSGVRITNLNGGLNVTDIESGLDAEVPSSVFASAGRSIQITLDSDDSLIADVEIDFTDDRDWSALTADSDAELGKAFIHDLLDMPGVTGADFTLYVPRIASDDAVLICPGATSLAQVTVGCSSGVSLSLGTSGGYTVTLVNQDSQDYWKIEGVTGSGGLSTPGFPGYTTPTNFTLTPNVSDTGDTQNVLVNFIASAEFANGGQIALDFDTGGDFTVASCASPTTDADGDTTADGAGAGVNNGGANNDRYLYAFTGATTDASTTGIELCISVTAPNTPGNYRVDLVDSHGDFYSALYYIGNENELNIIGTVDATFAFAIRNSTDTADMDNVGGGATGPNLCNLGNLSESGVQTCSYRLKVGANAGGGYSVNITTDGNLRSGSAFIDNIVEDSGTVTSGTEGYGIALNAGTATSGTVTEAGIFSDDDSPIGSGTNTILYSVNGGNSPTATDTTNTALVTHRAEADLGTAAGTYTQLITYTVSATF